MRLGIVDIGHNAIRAVVYESNHIGAPEIFNNKFRNDVLSLLEKDNIDIKHQTYLSLQYIVDIFDRLAVTNRIVVATAVLRDAPKAKEFVDHVYAKFGLKIEIISGVQEARLTACGLISGVSYANGIVVDLGGGSLEIARVKGSDVTVISSIKIGQGTLNDNKIRNSDDVVEFLSKHLKIEENSDKPCENLYLIGGALRFLSRAYLEYISYPMKNLHNFEINTKDFHEYLSNVQKSDFMKGRKIRKLVNQESIIIAEGILDFFKPSCAMVSNYGLKEGVRFENLPQEQKKLDAVIEKTIHYTKYDRSLTNFDSYLLLINSMLSFPSLEELIQNTLKLSIIFVSLTKYFDHTLPPKSLIEYVMSTEIPFSHKQRVMLTIVISCYSNFEVDFEVVRLSKKILNKNEFLLSQIIGHYLRICSDVDGLLYITPSFDIKTSGSYLEIITEKMLPRPIFEKICERLKAISLLKRGLRLISKATN